MKTGGGFGAEMLGRVSPVPTRRFKPLALWKNEIPLVGGKARTEIRLPEFVTERDFRWAVETASHKKKLDCSAAEFLTVEEGLCVQIMHLGPYDDEPATVALMDRYLQENGYRNDLSDTRLHHEIYLSDARKVEPAKWKTVIRHPIRKV